MTTATLLQRLNGGHPGWKEWDDLITLVESLPFESITSEHLGTFVASGTRLVFRDIDTQMEWPAWMPPYVPSLYGMKADYWEMAGGYAECFSGDPARAGSIFSPAGNDAQLGFPIMEVPPGISYFQANASGALFFIDKRLNVLYPSAEDRRFEILDSLEAFTKSNIRQALTWGQWFSAYHDLKATLLD